MLEPLGERHIRVEQEVVGTQLGFPLEEMALQRVLEDEKVAKALVGCPMVALEVGLADVVEWRIPGHVEEALNHPDAMLHIGAGLVQNHSQP